MEASNTQSVRCSRHDRARAAWQCGKCRKDLCPACAVADEVRNTRMVRCAHCGGLAEQILVRRPAIPWWNSLPAFLQAIFSLRGLIQLLVIGFLLLVARFMALVPLLGWILALFAYFGLYASYLFLLIGTATAGEQKLPALGSMGRELKDVVGSALRLFAATAIVWLPLFVYLYRSVGLAGLASGEFSFWSNPVTLIIVLVGLVYVPAAFGLAALSDSVLAAANPLAILAFISKKPGQYAGLAAFAGALFFGNALLELAIVQALGPQCFLSFGRTMLTLWLVRSLTLILPVLTALVLGRFIHQNAAEFGLPGGERLEPAVPGAQPQAQSPAQGWEPAQPAPVVAPVALELETTPAEALVAALKTGNERIALDSYRRLTAQGTALALPAEAELSLASLLEQAGDPLGAAHACRRAAQQDLRGPFAPQALFRAARLLIEQVGATQDGQALLRYLVQNYPGDGYSQQARDLLAE